MDMLKRQIDGSAGSWAICWYASAFLKDMYTLYPGQSLVQLNDIEGNGATHGSTPVAYLVNVKSTPINWNMVEDQIESHEGRKAFEAFFKSLKTWKSYIPKFIIKIKQKLV